MKFFIVVDSNAQPIYHNHSDKLVCHPLWAAHQFFSHNFQEALTSVTCVDGTRFALEKVRQSPEARRNLWSVPKHSIFEPCTNSLSLL